MAEEVGCPKTEESFEDLTEACTAEKHDQYNQSAADKYDGRKSTPNKLEPPKKAAGQSSESGAKRDGTPLSQNRRVCFNCDQPSHVARSCWKPRRSSEATGKIGGNP